MFNIRGISPLRLRGDADYISSEAWRCRKSPTGAHHWTITDDDRAMTCKYCGEKRGVAECQLEEEQMNEPLS